MEVHEKEAQYLKPDQKSNKLRQVTSGSGTRSSIFAKSVIKMQTQKLPLDRSQEPSVGCLSPLPPQRGLWTLQCEAPVLQLPQAEYSRPVPWSFLGFPCVQGAHLVLPRSPVCCWHSIDHQGTTAPRILLPLGGHTPSMTATATVPLLLCLVLGLSARPLGGWGAGWVGRAAPSPKPRPPPGTSRL